MDTVTQFLLGASLAGATLSPVMGRKSLLIGGLVATIPDLDVFVPMGNAIDNMIFHRGPMHSLIVLTAAAPAVAWAVGKIAKVPVESWRRLLLTVWLCLFTHPILDALTTYGTQIFWPLNVGPPVALPSIFIIDPLYTATLAAGVLTLLFMRQRPKRGAKINRAMLLIGSLYLCAGVAGHYTVKARAAALLELNQKKVFIQPTPFNLLVWQVLAVDRSNYYVGFTSPLSSCRSIVLSQHLRVGALPSVNSSHRSVKRLKWFTQGFYNYQFNAGTWSIQDLRIGFHPNFVYQFAIAGGSLKSSKLIDPRRLITNRIDWQAILGFVDRVRAGLSRCE